MNIPLPGIPLPEIDQALEVLKNIDTGDISIADIKNAIHRPKKSDSRGMNAISAKMHTFPENDAVKQLHFSFKLHLESTMCTRGLEEFAHSESAKER